jgi:hypothetical protein
MNDDDVRRFLDGCGQFTGRTLEIATIGEHGSVSASASGASTSLALLGIISPQMRGLLDDPSVAKGVRVSVFETELAQAMLVITMRAGQCQMRIVARLNDRKITQLLRDVERNEVLVLVLSTHGTCDRLGWTVPLPAVEARRLIALRRNVVKISPFHVVSEMALTAAMLQVQSEYFGCDMGAGPPRQNWVTTIIAERERVNLAAPPKPH